MLNNLNDQVPDLVRSTSGRARINRGQTRILLCFLLLVADCAAVRIGFKIGLELRGWQWLAPNGVELGWLILPLHLMFAFRNGAISAVAIPRLSASLRLALSAFFMATSVITLLIFFQYAGALVSRLALGVAISSTMFFIVLFRIILHYTFNAPISQGLIGELLIVDGVAPPCGADEVYDAEVSGLLPDLNNPDMLSRLGTIADLYDRIIVACLPERQQQWALLLKAYNNIGEILLDQGSPLGAIGLSKYLGYDTAVVSSGPLSLRNRAKKRLMDFVFSTLAIAFFSPLLLIVAIAIKLDSPGPILFSQTRIGCENRRFRILKFRTMRVAATDQDGARSTTRNDDRVTRLGRILRRTSIDELPQLLNVLVGDMSIVGPRPHALGSLAGDKLFWEVSQQYWLRHRLKPGITGLAQVRGYRGATHEQIDLENRLRADLEYIQGWRLSRDVGIILSTIFVIVHPRAF